MATIGQTAGELRGAAREAARRAIDDTLQAALERNGLEDARRAANLDVAVRRLEEQQRQTLALLAELRHPATPLPPAGGGHELAAPGPAGMAASEVPPAAAKRSPAKRAPAKRSPAKTTASKATRRSPSASTAKAAKTARAAQPRRRAAEPTTTETQGAPARARRPRPIRARGR
ncbi:MAG: hypothetical protein M3063_10450 [Actinomycetota bacterium]|nr:hypothetical protein [Actinomycetota bacterium]